ncbi:hypothetical protein [Phaeodactylibacter luteus]|uniref:Uncharacterized protein n=1 Tax=Phaeodactylibacter luteus TaxID=1564516 RepID=A0A5C6RMY7_9BACT|nr:hypothetical protein [Phaeodactylibacter luteus]TXB63299.1 hypothetical protein FRY97_09985 [Phaeodactylibacter luteus]
MAAPFIPEDLIEAAAAKLQDEAAFAQALEALKEASPVLLAYGFSESFEAFTAQEREYFLYLLLVIWTAVKESGTALADVDEQRLSELEEDNWNVLHGNKGGTFRARLDPFFEGARQEDLLAFIEDALTQDEEDEQQLVSREGQEALFVCLKTVVDGLTE